MQYDLCRHIKSNGLQCRAVALTDQLFCYFHERLNKGHDLYRATMVSKKSLMERGHIIALPPLEDRVSVQLALSEVINALACNFIDVQRANALLYGLRLAAYNARGLETITQPTEVVRDYSPAPSILDSVAIDLAPPGLTVEIDDSNDPAIRLDPGLAPGTYNQRTISATIVPPEAHRSVTSASLSEASRTARSGCPVLTPLERDAAATSLNPFAITRPSVQEQRPC